MDDVDWCLACHDATHRCSPFAGACLKLDPSGFRLPSKKSASRPGAVFEECTGGKTSHPDTS